MFSLKWDNSSKENPDKSCQLDRGVLIDLVFYMVNQQYMATFRIEVRKGEHENWFHYEELQISAENVRHYIRLVRTAYPNYWVRAVDAISGENIAQIEARFDR